MTDTTETYDRPVDSPLDIVVYYEDTVSEELGEQVAAVYYDQFYRQQTRETVHYLVDGRAVVIHANRDEVALENLSAFEAALAERARAPRQINIALEHTETLDRWMQGDFA